MIEDKNGVIIVGMGWCQTINCCKEKGGDFNYCILSEQIKYKICMNLMNVRPGEVSLLTDKGITELNRASQKIG